MGHNCSSNYKSCDLIVTIVPLRYASYLPSKLSTILQWEANTHRVDVLHDVLERGVRSKLLKKLPLIQQGVDQVGVVVQGVGQAGVDYLQHHADDLLNHTQILSLEDTSQNHSPNQPFLDHCHSLDGFP